MLPRLAGKPLRDLAWALASGAGPRDLFLSRGGQCRNDKPECAKRMNPSGLTQRDQWLDIPSLVLDPADRAIRPVQLDLECIEQRTCLIGRDESHDGFHSPRHRDGWRDGRIRYSVRPFYGRFGCGCSCLFTCHPAEILSGLIRRVVTVTQRLRLGSALLWQVRNEQANERGKRPSTCFLLPCSKSSHELGRKLRPRFIYDLELIHVRRERTSEVVHGFPKLRRQSGHHRRFSRCSDLARCFLCHTTHSTHAGQNARLACNLQPACQTANLLRVNSLHGRAAMGYMSFGMRRCHLLRLCYTRWMSLQCIVSIHRYVIITQFSSETAVETATNIIKGERKAKVLMNSKAETAVRLQPHSLTAQTRSDAADARPANVERWWRGRFDKPAGPGVGLSLAEVRPNGQNRPASALSS